MALDKPNVRAACPKNKLELIFFFKLCIKSTALGFIVFLLLFRSVELLMLMIRKWLLTRNSNLYLPAECLDSSNSVPDKTLVISTLCTLKKTSV